MFWFGRIHIHDGPAIWILASCRELVQKEKFKSFRFKYASLNFRYPKLDSLPYNKIVRKNIKQLGRGSVPHVSRSASRFSAKPYEVYFEDHAEGLELDIRMMPEDYHRDFRYRVSDSLNFLIGKRLPWYSCTIQYKNTKTKILKPFVDTGKDIQLLPPASPCTIGTTDSFWKVFASYLKTVGPHKGEKWHHLSAVHMMVLDSANASIHGQILILSVAIESLTLWGKNKIWKAVPVTSAEIDALKKSIRDTLISKKTRDRAISSISGFSQIRAQDVLIELEGRGQITSLMLRTWKAARNPAAHGSFREKETAGAISSDADILLALYYRLVMIITGYKGSLTDYSIKGWPAIELKKKLLVEINEIN